MKTKSSGPVTTIKFDLTGDCDLGAQYLAKIKDTPFDITGREDHADSAHAPSPIDPLGDGSYRGPDEAPAPMNWRKGDELPEHLRPAPGEELLADAAPSPWPRIVPIEQQQSDGAQSGDPPPASIEAAVTAAEQSWPTPSLADPTERQPWETIATADDAQDGYRYRAQSDTDGDGRVRGVTAGYVCLLCGSEAKQFTHVPGESRTRDACCDECRAGLDRIIDQFGGEAMAGQHLTDMERKAVFEARGDLFKALQTAGIADRFNGCTAEQMDSVIRAVWEGVRLSMQRQSNSGEIPF